MPKMTAIAARELNRPATKPDCELSLITDAVTQMTVNSTRASRGRKRRANMPSRTGMTNTPDGLAG